MSGFYANPRTPVENPLTGERFVIFKLLLVEKKK